MACMISLLRSEYFALILHQTLCASDTTNVAFRISSYLVPTVANIGVRATDDDLGITHQAFPFLFCAS
jgi:hypothetical protein